MRISDWSSDVCSSDLTPNIPELEALTGRTIASAEEALDAARALGDELGAAVLAKGGHLEGDEVIDQLVTREGVHSWTDRRIETRHTHGTGCTLASAIAAGLGPGMTLPDARSEEHTSELQSLMRYSYSVFCLIQTPQYTI